MILKKIRSTLFWGAGALSIMYMVGALVSTIASRQNNFVTTRYFGQPIDNSSTEDIKKEELEGFSFMYTSGAPGPFQFLQRLTVHRVEILEAPSIHELDGIRCGMFVVNEYTLFNIALRRNLHVPANFCA